MAEVLVIEQIDKVAHFRVNRPEKRNSINPELMSQLSSAFRDADTDDGIRVIVLSGVGNHFGAGYDLSVDWRNLYGEKSPVGVRKMLMDCVAFEFGPWNCSKPVIAMVRGYCLAGSCELSMMCCITYASETAKFGEPEIRFSATPPVYVMPYLTGVRRARELLYSGDMIDAQEALRIGLVNKVFDDAELEEQTMRYAKRVATVDLEALQLTKATMNRVAEIAGFKEAVQYGVETGTVMEASETESYRKFSEIQRSVGLTAAIRWREKQFE